MRSLMHLFEFHLFENELAGWLAYYSTAFVKMLSGADLHFSPNGKRRTGVIFMIILHMKLQKFFGTVSHFVVGSV